MATTDGQLQGPRRDFTGYVVEAAFDIAVEGPTRGQAVRPVLLREAVDADGRFRFAWPAVAIGGDVRFTVRLPSGGAIAVQTVAGTRLGRRLALAVPAEPKAVATPNADPGSARPAHLTGVLLAAPAMARLPDVDVVVRARREDRTAIVNLLVTRTGAGGVLTAERPRGRWSSAFAETSAAPGVPIPIALEEDGGFPARMILIVPAQAAAVVPGAAAPPSGGTAGPSGSAHGSCAGCGSPPTAPPRDPSMAGLVEAPEAFSADKGGHCIELAVPNRTIEEYPYTLIVRTTDPEIVGLRLPEATPRQLSVGAAERLATRGRTAAGRAPLDARNALDWDEEPTFYQATTIAHGHLVQLRQRWKADGYSLGDLLYSLPLAPAQKKQVAIIDWERRQSAERNESLLGADSLSAELDRDRDILEIVRATVDETMKGASAALSAGVGKGSGRVSPRGNVLGVAGGVGGGASGAIQDASRALAVGSLQQLNDRTMQSANALRSQRATVVQSVSEGETVRAQTESVANNNHCHAMTVEYFEVLRHFRVEHEVAGVDECLFVPLLMSAFDEPKALRWRSTLEPALRVPALAKGFDAIDRRRHQYEGADLPAQRYADEALLSLEGELSLVVGGLRPRDKADGSVDPIAWADIEALLVARGSPLPTGGNGTIAEQLAAMAPAARDAMFVDAILPVIVEALVDRLSFTFELAGGRSADAGVDASLVSRPRANVPLRVALRSRSAGTRPPRARVVALRIDTAAPRIGGGTGHATGSAAAPAATVDKLLAAFDVRALVRSASVRYRTAHREDYLLREPRLDDDLLAGDGVRIDTPLGAAELRNPREEDKEHARRLIAHLQEHLEFYHRAIWLGMDAARRYLLLDGIEAPGAGGRSVASVVVNEVVAVVGNSLVMPVAPGYRLDPTRPGAREPADLVGLYAPLAPLPPVRLSVPTRGVFAEAVMGECNACEKIDDTRFWRWEESPIPGEPTAIQPLSTDSRQGAAPDLGAKDFAPPMINLQNAPSAPDPAGLGAALQVLGASNLFRDVTGLDGNQRNAGAAMAASIGAAQAFGEQAGKVAAAKAVEKAAELQMQKQVARDYNRLATYAQEAVARGDITPETSGRIVAAGLSRLAGKPPPPAITMQAFREAFAPAAANGVSGFFDGQQLFLDGKPTPGTTGPTVPDDLAAGAVPGSPPSDLPDFVPQTVFLGPKLDVGNPAPDAFITAARGFHETWGFTVTDVSTFTALIDRLAAPDGPTYAAGQRVRLVCHALGGAQGRMRLPLFDGDPVNAGSDADTVSALARGPKALIAFLTGPLPNARDPVPTDPAAGVELWRLIASRLDQSGFGPLAAAFGLNAQLDAAEPVRPGAAMLAFLSHRLYVDQLEKVAAEGPPAGQRALGAGEVQTLIEGSAFVQGDAVPGDPQQVPALIAALKTAGSPFINVPFNVDAFTIIRLKAALAELKRPLAPGELPLFEKLAVARARLKAASLDIRGCMVGVSLPYLSAIRELFGVVEVTAPTCLMDFIHEFSTDVPVLDEAHFETLVAPKGTPEQIAVRTNPRLLPAMGRWALREFPDAWQAATNDRERARVFFRRYLKQHRVLAVNGKTDTDTVLLYYVKDDVLARTRWLLGHWGTDLNGRVGELARDWGRGRRQSMQAADLPPYRFCPDPGFMEQIAIEPPRALEIDPLLGTLKPPR